MYNTAGNPKVENSYYNRTYVDDAVNTTGQILYEVAKAELVWEQNALSWDDFVYPTLPDPKCASSLGPDPLLNLVKVNENCGNTFFSSEEEAKDCVLTFSAATTDYLYELVLEAVALPVASDTSEALSNCTQTIKVTVSYFLYAATAYLVCVPI